jgi:NADPH:quinone reductase-like Zn-dependent oxidoreductase/acyl carrier protein
VLRDAALMGALRVAVNEYPQQRIRLLDLVDPATDIAACRGLVDELLHGDAEDEIILAGEGRFAPRYADFQQQLSTRPGQATAAGVRLEVPMSASLRGLTWQPVDDRLPVAGEVEIEVRAAGLNFRDVMYSMGLLPDEALENGFSGPTLGMELSGVVRRVGAGVTDLIPGQEVLAFAPASFATRVYTRADAVVPKPRGWSHEAGATVPTAFFTAWYALHELARIEPGEKVLVHGGAGGVGIAAIQIARHLGAEVYATAGSTEKRDFVRLLGAARVFDSRSLNFADELLQATGGEGVDVVLNSVAGEAVRRNLAILRPFGRMLELGKRDFYENTRIGLRPFRNNVSYFGIDADQLMVERPRMARRVLLEMLALFESDALRPLPHVAFDASEIESAFAWMRDSRQTGKIVVRFHPSFAPAQQRLSQAAPVALQADASYLVTGGLTGFGLRTAQWLADRGARHLALMSRRGAASPGAQEAIDVLRAQGVQVQALACDVADPEALKAALQTMAQTMPPLRGVIHAAMVMEDALIRNSDQASLHRVLAPKAVGAIHLDQLTRHLTLDFFLMYSSVTTVIGNPGQVKYVAANAVLEALACERRAAGLAGNCVLWGPIADAGYLAVNEGVRDVLAAHLGAPPMPAGDALAWLDHVLADHLPLNAALLDADWGTMARHMHAVAAPRFVQLVRGARKETGGAQTSADLRDWLLSLAGDEFERALGDILKQEIGAILRIAPERINAGESLFDIGMDSLMALELATALDGRLGTRLPDSILSEAPTVERLVQRLGRMMRPVSGDDDADGVAADSMSGVRALMEKHGGDMSEEDMSRLASKMDGGGKA